MPDIIEWIIREEHTLFGWLLKHTILIEIAMIKLQLIVGYLILQSKTIPLEWLIAGGFLITLALRMVLTKVRRGRWI